MDHVTEDGPGRVADDVLLDRVEAMAPWHHKIDLRNGLSTGSTRTRDATGEGVSYIEPAVLFHRYVGAALPDGMTGKTFLDCGCNAGGYCFAAKDAGATATFGFDVRPHWIKQAKFVAANRERPSDGMRFEVADLLDLSNMTGDFDVTWFSGLLYHLPDPVAGLKIAADRTRDLLCVNTTVQPTEPGEVDVRALYMKLEGTEQLMSGVHTMSWLPGGAETMKGLLNWMGFPETRLVFWTRKDEWNGRIQSGRLMMIGARERGRLDAIEDAEPIELVRYGKR